MSGVRGVVDTERLCEIDGCNRSAHSGGRHCSGHAKRVERGLSLAVPLRENLSLRERVLQLAIDLVRCDSENDQEWERCWDALEHALVRWSDSIRGRRGGLARAAALSASRRQEIAKQAIEARWDPEDRIRRIRAAKYRRAKERRRAMAAR